MYTSFYTIEACLETECFVEPEFDCVELSDYLAREQAVRDAFALPNVLLDGGCYAGRV